MWRVERAARAAVLIDAAAFFDAVRRAFLQAERRIFIAGWDIDSRTRLVGEGNCADDGFSPMLAEFLSEIVANKPSLEVYLLLWDFSLNYAAERELFPRLSLQWQTPPRVTLCMDNAVPFGSSQHQKLIVVDDALAFSGGLDVTVRRWDCSDHAADNPERVDASGQPYPPFHDVQMMVDGDAAQALAQLVRRRWCNAHGSEPPVEPCGDPWPQGFEPQFTDVEIGIARTQPEFGSQEQVKEVETLFLDSIDAGGAFDLHREPVHDRDAGRGAAGAPAARASRTRTRRGRTQDYELVGRLAHAGRRAGPLSPDAREGRRRPCASRLSDRPAGRAPAPTRWCIPR